MEQLAAPPPQKQHKPCRDISVYHLNLTERLARGGNAFTPHVVKERLRPGRMRFLEARQEAFLRDPGPSTSLRRPVTPTQKTLVTMWTVDFHVDSKLNGNKEERNGHGVQHLSFWMCCLIFTNLPPPPSLCLCIYFLYVYVTAASSSTISSLPHHIS